MPASFLILFFFKKKEKKKPPSPAARGAVSSAGGRAGGRALEVLTLHRTALMESAHSFAMYVHTLLFAHVTICGSNTRGTMHA